MIRKAAIRSIKWTFVIALVGNLLQLLQSVIVSGFIVAADYGLMSITLVVIYFAQLLGDMGFSNAIIYKRQLSAAAFSSLFWLSLLFCWCMLAVLFVIAPLLADFFKQPPLTAVIRVTSLSFIFLPLQMQYLAFLKKDLHFDKIAIADFLSKLTGVLVASLLAISGYGVFALVYATISGMLVSTLLYWYWGSRLASISFNFNLQPIKELLHFGIYQTGNDVLGYFNFQLDTILLGKLLGMDAAGFYSFAKNLAMRPAQIINPVVTQVAFPLLAKVSNDTFAVKSIYLKMLRYLAAMNFLIYPFIAAFSTSIIRLFFADRWLPAAPALQALAFYCMLRSVFNPVGVLLSSKGMVKQLFYWNLLLICIVPVIVYISAAWGIYAVAASLSLLLMLLFVPMWRYLVNPACAADLKEFWLSVQGPLFCALILYLLLVFFNMLPLSSAAGKLASGALVWLLAGMALTRLFNRQLFAEAVQLMRHQIKDAEQLFSNSK